MMPTQWPMLHQWAIESVEANPGPHHPQLVPSIGVIVPVMTLESQQNTFHESRPVNIYTGDG